MVPLEIVTSLAKFKRIVCKSHLDWLSVRGTCVSFSSFLVKCLYPLSGHLLYNHRMPVIVARFTLIAEDLVVCRKFRGQTVEVSWMYLLSPCVLPGLPYHLSRNVEVLTYNDSTGDLHKLCPILANCLCKTRSGWHSHRGTSVSFSSFLVKFSFCMGSFVSTWWLILVQSTRRPAIIALCTLFVEHPVVGRSQVTQLCCADSVIV